MAGKKVNPDGVQFEKIKPKTKNQAELVKAIEENDVIICDGPAGTGKTLLSIGLGCEWLLSGKIETILISRTLIGCGDVGTFPGDEFEKSEPYFYAHLSYLQKILGSNYKRYLNEGKIVVKPLEMLRGHTYDKSLMILDEAQNTDGKQIKMFLTRMGHYSKAIIAGDVTQSDINPAGFRFCLNFLKDLEHCAVVNLDYSDILRNTRIAHVIRKFDENGYN